MRPERSEVGDVRRMLQAVVCDLPVAENERMFESPWELRAFAIAVAAYHSGSFDWSEFQHELITAIERWESGQGVEGWSYYEHWVEALENVLSDKGVLATPGLNDRTQQVLATPKNANHHHAHLEPVAVSPALTSPGRPG